MLAFSQKLIDNLASQGYLGHVNEALWKYLSDNSYTSSLPEALYAYLSSKGFAGEINEKVWWWSLEDYLLGAGIVTVSPPSFNMANLIVGNTLSSAYVAGSYTSTSGVVTEGSFSFLVDGIAQTGSYVLAAGDAFVEVPFVPLLIGGNPSSGYAFIADTPITNTIPVGGSGTSTVTVAPSAASEPDQMSAPTLAATATRVTVTKAADPADGGAAITSYDLRYSTNGGSSWTDVLGFTSPHVITGMTPGATGILVQTRAVNGIGDGAWSTSASVDMGTITYLGFVVGDGTGATITLPLTTLDTSLGGAGGSLQENDVLIVGHGWAVSSGDVDISLSGWTELFDLYRADTRAINFAGFWKAMGSTPDTSVVVQASNNSGNGSAAVVYAFRNVDPTTPLDVAVVTATGIDAALADAPSITPVSAGAKILAMHGATGDTTPASLTGPSGMTNIGARTNGGSTRGFRMQTSIFAWTSGAYDPAAITSSESATSDAWCAASIALKPW